MAHSILVVDDDWHLREIVALALTEAGYLVRQAGDGFKALHALQSAPCDLVLSDVSMPHLDGIRLAERISRLPESVPVILMSAATLAPLSLTTPVLGKPLDLETLLMLIARILGDGHQPEAERAPPAPGCGALAGVRARDPVRRR